MPEALRCSFSGPAFRKECAGLESSLSLWVAAGRGWAGLGTTADGTTTFKAAFDAVLPFYLPHCWSRSAVCSSSCLLICSSSTSSPSCYIWRRNAVLLVLTIKSRFFFIFCHSCRSYWLNFCCCSVNFA